MQIGIFPTNGNDSDRDAGRLKEFSNLLTTGKTVFQAVPDIQLLRWEKVVWNAAWNSLTTLTLMDTHSWLASPDAETLTRRLMTEVIDVGKALGVALDYDLIDTLVNKIKGMPPIGSSMRTDYENNKPMEVEIILGYPVRKGKELGINIATVETIYVILTAVNRRLMKI